MKGGAEPPEARFLHPPRAMPNPLKLLVLGIVIGSNNLAASLALGALGHRDLRNRVVAVFGVVEFSVPLLGIWAGRELSGAVRDHLEWLGPALLTALGLWAVGTTWMSWKTTRELSRRLTTWRGLFLLALGLSIDNLLIGFSLGLRGTEPLVVAATIGVFSMAFAWVGIGIGRASRRHWERFAELGAGLLLLLLAGAAWAGWI